MSIVRVSWSAPSTGNSPITSYTVQRRTSTGAWGTLSTTAASAGFFDDTTPTSGTQYGYRIAASNAIGMGPFSAEATVTVPSATSGVVLFDADVANKGLSAYPTSVNPQDVTVVDDPILGAARKVMKFTVHETDNTLTGNPRAQLESPKIFNEGDEIYIGYSQLFPTAWPNALPPSPAGGANFVTMAEVYGPPYSGSSPVKINMRANQAKLGFQRNGTYGFDIPWEDGPILKNTWYDWVIHEKLSQDPAVGFVEIYRNLGQGWVAMPLFGATRLYTKTIDSSNNGGPNYHKIALYYASNMGVGDPLVLYHGHHKIATTFDLAAPQSYSTTATPPTGASGLAVYAGGPNITSAAAQTVTTGSFTAPAGSVLVANVMYNGTSAATGYACSASDSTGLTWTTIRQIDNVNNSGGKGGVYTAWARVGASAVTLTVAGTATVVGTTNPAPRTILDVEVLTGAPTTGSPIGAVVSSWSTSGPFSVAATSTGSGSLTMGAVCDWNASGTPSPAAGVTLEASTQTPNITGSVLYRAPEPNVGTSEVIASTSPASTDQNVVVYEVLAATASTTGAPTVPTNVAGTTTTTTATITWAPPSGGSTVTGYRVSRNGTDSTGAGAFSTVVAADQRSYTFGSLVTGSPYILSVAATSAVGDSPAGNVTLTPTGPKRRLVAYYPDYARGTGNAQATPATVNYASISHLADFSVGLTSTGALSATWTDNSGNTGASNYWSAANANAMVAGCHSNNVKALLVIGNGGTSNSFNAALGTSTLRATVATNIANYMATYGYDGVDLDGEPAASIPNYNLLIQAIIAEFTTRGWRTVGSASYKTVSVVCFGSETAVAKAAIVAGADWVAPQLYNPYDGSISRHLSPIAGPGDSWDAYIGASGTWRTGTNPIPAAKILPGMSYNVFRWSGATGPNQAATGQDTDLSWSVVSSSIVDPYQAVGATWDPTAQMHGKVINVAGVNKWHSFETARSVQAKANYVNAQGLGGAVIWNYTQGSLGGTSHPLAGAAAQYFGPLFA